MSNCQALTKRGIRCKNQRASGCRKFCWIHRPRHRPVRKINHCKGFTLTRKKCKNKPRSSGFCHLHEPVSSDEESDDSEEEGESLPKRHCKGLVEHEGEFKLCGKHALSMSRDGSYCSEHAHSYRLEKPEDCAACMNKISEEIEIPLSCGHWIHGECMRKWERNICPICRNTLNEEESIRIRRIVISNTPLEPARQTLFGNIMSHFDNFSSTHLPFPTEIINLREDIRNIPDHIINNPENFEILSTLINNVFVTINRVTRTVI